MLKTIDRTQQSLLPDRLSENPDDPVERIRINPLLGLFQSARRHWVQVLLIWAVTAAPISLAIWRLVRPMYTASAHVEVIPVRTFLLSRDELDPIDRPDTFLNTQAQMVSDSSVLRAALADPTLQGLPLLAAPDQLMSLRRALKVQVIPRTNLLRVNIQQPTAEEAIRVGRAVMRAYEAFAGGNDARKRADDMRILREQKERLAADLQSREREIAELAKRYNATSQEMFTALRENKLRISEQTAGELERARIEQTRLEAQLRQLEKDLLPTTMPAEDFLWRDQWIENDLVIAKIRQEIAQEKWSVLRFGNNPIREKRIQTLEAQLEEQKKRISEEADRRVYERRKAMLDDAKRKIHEQLAAANQLVASLQTSYDALKTEVLEMGRLSLEIQQLQYEAESRRAELARVENRLRELEIANRRPARISVSLEPEILADGVQDSRRKLIPVVVMGTFLFAFLLVFLKDLASGRLYTTRDVENRVGLRLLGTLPSLTELRRGRVSEDDFRESYRALRATLAGASPDGRIPASLLVTSAEAAEGKTSLAVSLAAILAEAGSRVLLVDGDVQAPRISQTLRLNLPYSLRHVLLGKRELAEAVGASPIPSLEVLPSDRNGHSARGLLTGALAVELLRSAAGRYDHVIIDSPPVLGSADAVIWSQAVGGVIISSRVGHSNFRVIRRACEQVASVGGRILGAVLCNVSAREHFYSYSSYSGTDSLSVEAGHESSSGNGSGHRPSPYVLLPVPASGDADPGHPGGSKA